MYGWIHNCLKEATVNLCGEEKWNEICAKAGVVDEKVSNKYNKTKYIKDEEHFALVDAALELMPHISEQELYDIYGHYFIAYLQKNGYESYLLTFGDTLFELLNNMNRLHLHFSSLMDKMKLPDITCVECDEEDTFMLHYTSPRGDRLVCLLVGMIKSLARTYFSKSVTMEELARQGDASGSPCTTWKVKETDIPKELRSSSFTRSSSNNSLNSLDLALCPERENLDSSYSLSADQFSLLSPCHVVFDNDFLIVQMSDNMSHLSLSSRARYNIIGSHLKERFSVSAVTMENITNMDWGEFHTAATATNEKQQSFRFETKNEYSKSGKPYSYIGKILFLKNDVGVDHAAVFLCSPNVHTIEEMYDQRVNVKDLKNKDDCRLEMLLNEANVKHFQESNSEANEKLQKEVLTSEKAKGDLDAKRRLLMYISHEIRTPLSNVNFGFQLIKTQLNKLDVLHEEEGILSASRSTTPRSDIDHQDFLVGSSSPDLESSVSSLGGGSSRTPSNRTATVRSGCGSENTDVSSIFTKQHQRHLDIRAVTQELDAIITDSSHSVQVAISILNDLLNYEKLQANVLDLFKEMVPCVMVKSVVDEFHVEASYFQVRLSFRTSISYKDQNNVYMKADKQKISQVIRNYISNALKFTPAGGSVTVTSAIIPLEEANDMERMSPVTEDGTSYRACGYLRFTVRDTGAGIDKENHGRVFNEMVQFSPNELQGGGGSGLGLFITKSIVNKHGGTVGFESEGLKKGCTFFFTLPVFRVDASNVDTSMWQALNEGAGSESIESRVKGRTMLICDDSDLARKMLKKILMSMGCKHCCEAKNGVDAVKLTENRLKTAALQSSYDALPAFDYILIDDVMPSMSGPEAVRRIRELGFRNPIIGVSGNVASEDVDHFISCGADAVLSKPLDMTELNDALQQCEYRSMEENVI